MPGELLEKKDKTDNAREYYLKALEIDGRNSDAHYHLGVLLYKSKKSKEAHESLKKATERK